MILSKTISEEQCDFELSLLRYGGLETRYNTRGGLQRRITLSARVDSPRIPGGPNFSAPHFHQKAVRLVIVSPPDSKWLAKIGETHNVPTPCGEVTVSAGVEPDRFEIDGETVESAPVEVTLSVAAEAFDAIRDQAVAVHDHSRLMGARMTLTGSSLPSKSFWLKDLDVSVPRRYAVSQFEVHDDNSRDCWCDRVLPKRSDRDANYCVSVLLGQVRYELVTRGLGGRSISCEGSVTGRKGQPYQGMDATVDFVEHERNEWGHLPKQAVAGQFTYWPRGPRNATSDIRFRLMYVPKDARDLLAALLIQDLNARVIAKVHIAASEKELHETAEELKGDVHHYELKVTKSLTDTRRD